jgi:MoaA/NifB/PqqE/SkfB family radical SAM enzyme
MEINETPIATAVQSNYPVYDVKAATDLFKGRDLYIWGAGQKGKGFRLALKRNGFEIKAFLDKSPLLKGTTYQGIPIQDPETVLSNPQALQNAFLLVASVDKKNAEIFKACEQVGLKKGADFINIQELSPYYPTVEISGTCNLRCISCPRGNSDQPLRRGGFMRAAEYQKVAEKLVREIPFLYLVDIYMWGEPFLNPDLAAIIKINTELGIATGISSNLNIRKNLEEVMKAAPAQIRISLSGFGKDHYEETHTGGSWDSVMNNLSLVADYVKKYQTGTLVEIYYHVNKNNKAEAKKIRQLCEELGFRFHASISMLFHDYAMDFMDGNTLCEEAQRGKAIMTVSLEEMIETARDQKEKPCLLKRVVPIINWDLSVLPCCNYSSNKIGDALVAKNFLETPLQEIVRQRAHNPLCVKCQGLSLHRYFNPVYYSDYINALIDQED